MTLDKRASGILLHPTSLPSPYGVGDFGPGAYDFLEFLSSSRQSYWQMLPLTPTDVGSGSSPYSGSSAFAGNALLISPELLAKDGLLSAKEIRPPGYFRQGRVDYEAAGEYKTRILEKAFERFRGKKKSTGYRRFCADEAHWLEDFSLFAALKIHFRGLPWSEWPRSLRDRHPAALNKWKKRLRERIEMEKFLQYCFARQYFSLKNRCNKRGVGIIGDLPIYVSFDSADVWSHPEFFKLDEEKNPLAVAGVPPDYFSRTGQLWGNPIYRWKRLRENGYGWWLMRMGHSFKLYDLVRIDHFRGFAGYWEVRAGKKTAMEGRWKKGPGADFFRHLLQHFPRLPIIAEDLGVITPDVRDLIRRFGLPGMKVLQFAFGSDMVKSAYIPHNYTEQSVVYTGTHDNNTVRGWFENEASAATRKRFFSYLGREISGREVNWVMIGLAMMSIARLSVFPVQDILGLGEKARMNFPGRSGGNWQWRLKPGQLKGNVIRKLTAMTEIYGRARSGE